jgi:hypothetical protein
VCGWVVPGSLAASKPPCGRAAHPCRRPAHPRPAPRARPHACRRDEDLWWGATCASTAAHADSGLDTVAAADQQPRAVLAAGASRPAPAPAPAPARTQLGPGAVQQQGRVKVLHLRRQLAVRSQCAAMQRCRPGLQLFGAAAAQASCAAAPAAPLAAGCAAAPASVAVPAAPQPAASLLSADSRQAHGSCVADLPGAAPAPAAAAAPLSLPQAPAGCGWGSGSGSGAPSTLSEESGLGPAAGAPPAVAPGGGGGGGEDEEGFAFPAAHCFIRHDLDDGDLLSPGASGASCAAAGLGAAPWWASGEPSAGSATGSPDAGLDATMQVRGWAGLR